MKWLKRDLIFDIEKHALPKGCIAFAQSPQAILIDDFVRVYFSTRSLDPETKKFISHIAYVDFDYDFKNILKISETNVIELGGLGSFDEHGIFPFSPVWVNDKIYAYTCGWSRRVSVSVETSTGLAISQDKGNTYERYKVGPVLTSSIKEPMLVGDSFVLYENNTFHMWYIFGVKWTEANGVEPPARVYKIAYARSSNGIDWIKNEGNQIITDLIGEDECQALPTVVKLKDRYHMYFCYRYATDFRTNPNRGYRLGYAYSDDGINWTRSDETKGIDTSEGGWDSNMMAYPNIFKWGDKTYLLYNGNEFGKYGFGLAELISD